MRPWWLVVAPVVVVVIYVATTFTPPGPIYQVVLRFTAGTQPYGLSEDFDRYYPWVASEYIAKNMAEVAATGAFADAVAARLAVSGYRNLWQARVRPIRFVESTPEGRRFYHAGGIYRIRLEEGTS